jgi:GNAT superfamily N-acetyltransferase
MIGNRPSSLPIARFCARAPALNVGAGRAAAMSSVWHARSAGHDWKDAYERLTQDERDDIDSWRLPSDIILENVCLTYADARKEVRCGLAMDGSFSILPEALTVGTCDFHWFVDGVLYVADLKKSEFTEPDGPRSLQILCYALALTAMYEHEGHAVRGFVPGIWHATEATWEWGDFVDADLFSSARDEAWAAVRAAALHTEGDFSTGAHCRRCYSRGKCPAYLVPPEHANDGISKYLVADLDGARALELRRFLERVQTTIETAKERLEAYADANGGIVDAEAGKVWKASTVKGRARIDTKSLEADHPELVQKYVTQGAPHVQYRWVNHKEKS